MAERGPLKRHISKSASDLSDQGRLTNELEGINRSQTPSAGPANSAQSVPQLSVAQKTHSFFNTLRIRWSRSRSRERKSKKKLGEDGWVHKDSGSTDYAADNSSDHSSSATQSPQHRNLAAHHTTDSSPLAKSSAKAVETNKSRPHQSSSTSDTILPALPIYPTTSEENKSREALLCQHSFFQLRVHLKRGVDLVARDKGGTSDPYVKFKVGGRLLYKSKTIYRDLNPVWDEIFTIPIEDAFVPVHIKVFDYDWGLQDDFMGSAYLDLTKLNLGKASEITLELLDPRKTEYLGEIYLTVTLYPKTQEDKDLFISGEGRFEEHEIGNWLKEKLETIKMQGDFGTLKKVKKKLIKLGVKEKHDADEAEDLPEDTDKEVSRKKLKQKLIMLREKLGEEIYEESEIAKLKLKQKIMKLTEKLLKAEKDDEDEVFEDAENLDKKSSILKEKFSKLGSKLKPEDESDDDEDEDDDYDADGDKSTRKSVSAKIISKISKMSEKLRKEDETKDGWKGPKTAATELEEILRKESGSDENSEAPKKEEEDSGKEETGSEEEGKLNTSKRIRRKLRKLFDSEPTDLDSVEKLTGTSKKTKVKIIHELLKKEDQGDKDSLNSEDEREGGLTKLKRLLGKNEKGLGESSDTDRCESENLSSQGRSEATDISVSEGRILEKLGQRLKERSDKVQRYFQRTGKIGEVNRRLKSQIWSSVVTIVLVEGKNLQPMDIDGFSDPYVKFRLGNEKYKSKVVFKNLNPSWLEQFDFHLYDDQNQELEVTVWDKDKSKDDFMGRCNIDLSSLEREKTHGLWQDLEEGGGSIHLLLTISGTTASETISDLTTYEDNVRERQNIENRYALKNSLHNLRDVGHLTVKVYRATGLAAADLGGKSDPFCVLELVNARLQTQTEYKTLAPSWQKIFTFNVKDINSVLEVTVYDEDRDHKVEFLGKIAIPLLRIRNGEKRWYCLKDKKLHTRAKGNCPMILLEMYVLWNPVRAWIRTLNPKEEKYMQGEVKFKRQVFVRNVLRLKAIIMIIIGWGKLIQDCFEWERPAQSAVALVLFIALCYYFEPYMIPIALLIIFLKYYIVLWLTGEKSSSDDDEEHLFGDDDEDDEDKDKEEKKSLKERLQAIQEVTQTVQNAIGYIASLGEQIKNTFNFTVPFVSYLAIGLSLAAMVVMYVIPVRYLIMIAGVNKFARKLIRPHTIPNNEILDLLSRVPDDEDLIAYREFRPYSSSDVERRREQRKKHKAS